MRERGPLAPSGAPGMGERLPSTGALPTRAQQRGPAIAPEPPARVERPARAEQPGRAEYPDRAERPARPAAPSLPSVPTPAAAQGVRTVDESGALSEIRTTRASDDSPVEVTGPVDWSSTAEPPVAPAADAARTGGGTLPASSSSSAGQAEQAPSRRSVLGRASGPSWAPVTGEIGALVPMPSDDAPPPPEDAFDAAAVASIAVAAADTATGAPESGPEKRRGFSWFSPVGYVLLALLGVGIGVGLYYFVLR